MSKWMTTGMWVAHFAALLGKKRLRIAVGSLESRLASAEEQISAMQQILVKTEEKLSSTVIGLADAQAQLSSMATRLTEAEDRLAHAERRWPHVQTEVQADEHACVVNPESCVSPSAWERLSAYFRREAGLLFNVVLALFVALSVSAVINFLNERDFERLLDFFVYYLSTFAAMVAGTGMLFRAGKGSGVDRNAYYFKISALILITGSCAYLALKGAAPKSFYTLAGFSAFVFSSYLMLWLDWAARSKWDGLKVSKAVLYICLWLASVAVAVGWAWMVSSEHPNVKIATDAVRPLVS